MQKMSCNASEIIDLSTPSTDNDICITISDEEDIEGHETVKDRRSNSQNEEKTENPPIPDKKTSCFFSSKTKDIEERLKLAIQKSLEERRSMGNLKTPSTKQLKLKQKSWSQVRCEKEKEKMVASPQMPRLNKITMPLYISSESENEELPDLEDFSEVINISDDESKYPEKFYERISDSEGETAQTRRQSRQRYSTSTDDEDVTVVSVHIVKEYSSMEDSDDYLSPPTHKKRKISGSPLKELTSNLPDENMKQDVYPLCEETEKDMTAMKSEIVEKVSKDKIANFLNNIKSKVNLKSIVKDITKKDIIQQTVNETKQVSNKRECFSSQSSSINRHFTDWLRNDSDDESDIEIPQQRKFKKKKRRVFRRYIDEDKAQGKLTSYYNVKKDNHKKCFWQRQVAGKVKSDLETSLIGAFSQFHINTVEGCWEDEQNTGFMKHGLKFFQNFSNTNMPPQDLIQRIIREGIVLCKSEELMNEAYDCIMLMYEKHPDILLIDYKYVEDALEGLNFGQSFKDQDRLIVCKTVYILRLIILNFEYELTSKNISDPKVMRMTAGYKSLSHDCAFNKVKELVNYLRPCLTNEQTFQNEIPQILPLLQKLLYLSIEVSSNCSAAAKAIALELVNSYIYLPSIDHKKLLIQTLESNLLRYYLVTLVLERQCEYTVPCYDFPSRLQQIFSCFFKALPPTNVSTPPTTPQSDDEMVDNDIQSTAGYAAINVEELLMLLFEVLQCYVQCEQEKSSATLRRRAYMKREDFQFKLSEEDKDTIMRNIEELRGHALLLTPDLTAVSEQYFTLMFCVVDWQRSID